MRRPNVDAGAPFAPIPLRTLLSREGVGGPAPLIFDSARAPAPLAPQPVFVARGQCYDGGLARTIADGLRAVGLGERLVAGRRVLLKPNLVAPDPRFPLITTHPAVIAAAIDVFRRWGASVVVGEGSGVVRDSEMIQVESGLDEVLEDAHVGFSDLNYDDIRLVANRGRASGIGRLRLPRTVAEADLVVSIPKLKTHHLAGMTAAMKNLYGILPGTVYGWPKNILHFMGISETVFDIASSLPRTLAIIDAIDCMEGFGPIMGSCKAMGLVLVGTDLAAVDATCARIMGRDPLEIGYLKIAHRRGRPVSGQAVEQRGERWEDVHSFFQPPSTPATNAHTAST